jgi:hypothetical protein
MSVWDTFSASLHLVQEKLEQVLEDSTTEDQEQHVQSVVAAEDVDGRGADVTTTEQPRSPLRQDRGEVAEHADLEAAEQQMVLIHEEYKKLLREKEDEILQLKSLTQDNSQLGVGVVSKELAAHKEMVAELRKQLVEKENELQVHCTCTCTCMHMPVLLTCNVHLWLRT